MRRLGAIALLLAALGVAAPGLASAQEMEMQNETQGQRTLSLQALALLAAGRQHQEAELRLDDALKANPEAGMRLEALRAAHQALHREDAAAARQLLERAFPAGHSHVAGTTFRPDIASSRIVAAILGAALLGAAAFGLARRRPWRPTGSSSAR